MSKAGTIALVLAASLAAAGSAALRFAPPRYLPWTPLEIGDEPLPIITALKRQHARLDLPYCRAALATSRFAATPVAEASAANGRCRLHDVERIDARDPPLAFSSAFMATCPLAIDLAFFMEHVVEPAAQHDMHSAVVRIDHLGTFACRAIAGTSDLSQHASANAIDIAGFVFADGAHATVAQDWRGSDDKARFIHDVHDGACGIFPVVLGPAYNAAHQGHLHLDESGFRFCR
jgi:hypothetical protein